MKLYLLRHAIAEEGTTSGDDQQRSLTALGKAKMTKAVEGLRKMKVRPALILTSPLRRARETADILANGLAVTKVEVMAELAPGFKPAQAAAAIKAHTRHKSIALVGHQPGLGELAAFLLIGADRRCEFNFKKGGVACIEADFSGGDFTRCALEWFATPKLLRSL